MLAQPSTDTRQRPAGPQTRRQTRRMRGSRRRSRPSRLVVRQWVVRVSVLVRPARKRGSSASDRRASSTAPFKPRQAGRVDDGRAARPSSSWRRSRVTLAGLSDRRSPPAQRRADHRPRRCPCCRSSCSRTIEIRSQPAARLEPSQARYSATRSPDGAGRVLPLKRRAAIQVYARVRTRSARISTSGVWPIASTSGE